MRPDKRSERVRPIGDGFLCLLLLETRVRRSWRSSDSVVVLAAYLERPRGHALPPAAEQQRVANLLGVDVAQVRRRLTGFMELDRGGAPRPGGATHRDRRLWLHYRDDPMRLATDAEWIVEGRKWRPKWLYE